MEFSEADDPFVPPRRRPGAAARRSRSEPPAPPPQPPGDLLRRRLMALVIGGVILVALLFGIRGCLDARKERNYENYLRDLSAIVTTSRQLSTEFFQRLDSPGELSIIELQDQLGSSRGTGEDLLRRAQGLDAPDELGHAQGDLELAFELRRDALSSIVEQVRTALGDEGRQDAIDQIASDMREFLASDVLYARARTEVEEVLAEEEISGDVPESVFLPDTDPWLDELQLSAELAQVAGETGAAGGGERGTELSSTVLKPGNVPLVPESLNALGQPPNAIEISVLNGGTEEEIEIPVTFQLQGGTETVEGSSTISRIGPGNTESALVPVSGEIPAGEELTLVVTVLPVPGETIVDNNESTYQVLFE